METEIVKWLVQQTPAVILAVLVLRWVFLMVGEKDKQIAAREALRDQRDERLAQELKLVAETLASVSTTLSLLFNRIKGGNQ